MKKIKNKILAIFNNFFFFILKKEILFAVCFSIVLVLFHIPIEDLFYNTIVKYVLSKITTWWVNDIIILILIFILLIELIRSIKKKYVVSFRIFLSVIILMSISIVYRFNDNWIYTRFQYIYVLYYTDVFFVLYLGVIILYIGNYINKKHPLYNANNELYNDAPVGELGIDRLGYTNYAITLSNKIKQSRFDRSFAIGVNGLWGSGKTSFIDLMKREFKSDDDILVIDFNSWNSHTPNGIIRDFFETVQNKLKHYHSSASSLLITYANKLVKIHDNDVTKGIQTSVSLITGIESVDDIKFQISSIIENINKKLVIIIDDLDRLDKDEIVEVIRLIRNTANFSNTFFIVSYDKSYVTKALEKHNGYNEQNFLEKIFQTEINLPQYSSNKLNIELAELLKKHLGEAFYEEIDKILMSSIHPKPLNISGWLTTMRDVNRLMNGLSINLSGLMNNISLKDLIALELIRLKFPNVYTLLYTKRSDFFEFHTFVRGRVYYKLKESISERNLIFSEYLKNNDIINKNEINKVVELLANIFPTNDAMTLAMERSEIYLSVRNPSKFERYFKYNLQEGELSEVEFYKAISGSFDELKTHIDNWVDKHMEIEIVNRFGLIQSFTNREQFEKIIKAIFYLGNKTSFLTKNNNLIGFENNELQNQLSNYKNKISTNIYNGDKAALDNFIRSLFDNAPYPYINEAELIRHITHQSTTELSVSKEDLLEINKRYLLKYCQLPYSQNDGAFWHLYNCCKITEWIPQGPNSHVSSERVSEEIKEIAKTFIREKALDDFLLNKIDVHRVEGAYGLENFFFDEGWDEFEKFIFEIDESKWKYLKEFKVFYIEFKKNGMKPISFEFNDIPVEKKFRLSN